MKRPRTLAWNAPEGEGDVPVPVPLRVCESVSGILGLYLSGRECISVPLVSAPLGAKSMSPLPPLPLLQVSLSIPVFQPHPPDSFLPATLLPAICGT